MARENSEEDGHGGSALGGNSSRPPRDADTVDPTSEIQVQPDLPDDIPDLPGLDELPDAPDAAPVASPAGGVSAANPATITITLSAELDRYLRLRAASRSIEPAVYLRSLLEEDRRRGIQRRIRDLLTAGAHAPNEERTEADWQTIERMVRKRLDSGE
jgi:hypothetical protein